MAFAAAVKTPLAGLLLVGVALATGGCLAPGGGPVRVWAVDETTDVRPASPPVATSAVFTQSTQTVALKAAVNETVAFQLVCRAAADRAGPFDVVISDLTGPAGRIAASELIRRYRAHYVEVRDFPSWFPNEHPVPLEPFRVADELVPWDAPRGGGPLELSADENALVWVDVRVPPTAEPGDYAGEVMLRRVGSAGAAAARLTLRLRVRPVALPTAPTLPVICRVAPHELLAAQLNWDVDPGPALPLWPDEPAHRAATALVDATMQLLHAHRMNPVLAAAYPRHQLVGPGEVDVAWGAYDALVAGWIDGSAYPDRVASQYWPLPASVAHPDAQRNGGVRSARYARLLGAYLQACAAHFAERGWADRAFLRLAPPQPLNDEAIGVLRQLLGIVRQHDVSAPFVAHAPLRSLRGLGWFDAPEQDLVGVDCWAPPASWYEPEVAARERELGRATWLAPTHPPFSGSLMRGAAPTDVRSLAWQAYRYGDAAAWIERAADGPEALTHPGRAYGVYDRPLPTLRLKRLRRAVQDHDLLTLLARVGRPLLARRLAQQLAPYGYADACGAHLLSVLPTGWSRDPQAYVRARAVALDELTRAFGAATDAPRAETDWRLLREQAPAIRVEPAGVRLEDMRTHLRMRLLARVFNADRRAVEAQWTLSDLPPGWTATEAPKTAVAPGAQRLAALVVDIKSLSYNRDGVYPLRVACDLDAAGRAALQTRLAVAVAPHVEHAIEIDGDLSDWPLGVNNAAGDFQLVRGERRAPQATGVRAPTAPTRGYFCVDGRHLYVAIRCGLVGGEAPLWQTNNVVPIAGAIPWGQDLCEVVLSPSNVAVGLPSELYLLQIKPTGLLTAFRGCPTDPPIGAAQPWNSRARVAVQRDNEAWTAELAIPLDAFDSAARRRRLWGANLTRLDARRGEYASWSGARGDCYSPASLGNLMLLAP